MSKDLNNISFIRNGKEFEPTKRELKIVVEDLSIKIADLEAKLAEKEKENTRLKLLLDSFDKLKQYDKDADLILINPKTCYTDGKELVVKADNQDKIDFCFEKLTKVKLYAQHLQCNSKLLNYIEDLIKQLKEGK